MVCLLVSAFAIPSLLYVLLSLPGVQRNICTRTEKELTRLLNMNVSVKNVSISPFNRVTIYHAAITDNKGDTAMAVERVGAGINLFDLLAKGKIVLNYAEIIGLDARLKRDNANTPLNIQPMIAALSPKEKNKPPKKFQFAIRTVVIRNTSVSYDVTCEPHKAKGIDKNHLAFSHLRADINLPRIANEDFIIDLRRLALNERSGLNLKNLRGIFHITSGSSEITGLELELPNSAIYPGDIKAEYGSLKSLPRQWHDIPLNFSINKGSHIHPSDLAWIVPELSSLDCDIKISMQMSGTAENTEIRDAEISCDSPKFLFRTSGIVNGLSSGKKENIEIDMPELELKANAPGIIKTATALKPLASKTAEIINALGNIEINGSISGRTDNFTTDLSANAAPGTITLTGNIALPDKKSAEISGNITATDFNAGKLLQPLATKAAQLEKLSFSSDFDINVNSHTPYGKIGAEIHKVQYRGIEYNNITANAEIDGTQLSGTVHSESSGLALHAEGHADTDPANRSLNVELDLDDIDLASLGILPKYNGYSLSGSGTAQLRGNDVNHMTGEVALRDIDFINDSGHGIRLDSLIAESIRHDEAPDTLVLSSPVANGILAGEYNLTGIAGCIKSLIAAEFPALFPDMATPDTLSYDNNRNNFRYSLTLKDTDPISQLVKLPVSIIYPVNITGQVSTDTRSISLSIDAPYLQQKDKLIENTSITAHLSGDSLDISPAKIYCTTKMPTKEGDMTLALNANGGNNNIDMQLLWQVARERAFKGDVNLTAMFNRQENENGHELATKLQINPGNVVFNDTTWVISPALIEVCGKRAAISDFRVGHDGQFITMEGTASDNPADSLVLTLQDVNLNYVFETLDISAAMFGGNATGVFYATSLFSPLPRAYTPDLYVQNFSYNSTVLGDTHIRSEWLPEDKTVTIKADVTEKSGRHSYVDGRILPACDSLDFRFRADKLPIGFLQPFMSAFADEVSGYASGTARLWGTFKLIDMVGDIYGENVTLKLGFTNTSYTATDSVHLSPGRIDLRNLTLHDMHGHSARLNGWVTHEFFKRPKFEFLITDARDMLVYDVKENNETNWYGRIFGNGSASVSGAPGIVNIGVNMTTAANSTFTFVLSDTKQAYDYTFITFRNRDRAMKDSIEARSAHAVVRDLKKRIAKSVEESAPSVYNMNIAVDVTPQAQMVLVMDPVGGDRIKANGSGNLRMAYNSADEELRMFGTYTLDRGSYNFTLQDIIIKDFTIKPGSSIVFHGDPYAAQLGIQAVYAVNANLSDLDESFLEDKDLNRTNVPVHALLKVSGDMRQPDIDFDLEFPTLTSDTYRKVRSIVSTEEMMNRQIIYLLALNRFYTPDYVSATKGNELVSVASSTLSSQLSSMLGALSENWSIAPNLRSDRGDFSDVEFDLALSSHLLNNRLLLNGNLGYRDKSLNNNSFIGDFDIEYLINRSGTIRLKAYNRYNDQNYYVKSALTTQGVGVVFKRDFDNIFSFLRPIKRFLRRKRALSAPIQSDTIKTQ